jgi:hypothetical protein
LFFSFFISKTLNQFIQLSLIKSFKLKIRSNKE